MTLLLSVLAITVAVLLSILTSIFTRSRRAGYPRLIQILLLFLLGTISALLYVMVLALVIQTIHLP